MIQYIKLNQKKYKNITLNILPQAQFNDILKVLNRLEFIESPISSEQIIFAILELLNNSLRAHKEKRVRKNIKTVFSVQGNSLYIKVQDWGGGFDPRKLPYDLNGEVEALDTNNESFQEYRENHGYMRFGIGLYVVKKTFTSFNLSFIDEHQNPVNWSTGSAQGTCIELTLEDGTHEL